jgi:hypothetical protein
MSKIRSFQGKPELVLDLMVASPVDEGDVVMVRLTRAARELLQRPLSPSIAWSKKKATALNEHSGLESRRRSIEN